ncbi:two component transcriptional regulator [Caballeronia temeraria]|uniref:Two component transcriptional regulator n=1 Tax=Caballeronia temeraria TaxID=1777137 RepID=A0A158CPQ2_9BURK|nr:response regulator [Caballeronia temeraria]SAK84322.1 two component transcriptional regulator [Caballeronia temeraria]
MTSKENNERGRSPAVLLIDDDFDTRQVWSMVFELEGLTAITATDGEEGLNKAQALRPDIVICDFMMPGMNGLEVCRRLRADGRFEGVALILWSAARGIDPDNLADLLVEKPAKPEVVLAHVRDLLHLR